MKKFICSLLVLCIVFVNEVHAEAIATSYGSVDIVECEVEGENLVTSINVSTLIKKESYMVEVTYYKYEDNELNGMGSYYYYEGEDFKFGKNSKFQHQESLDLLFDEEGIYAVQAILHDADNYDWDEMMPAACFGWSDYYFLNVNFDAEDKYEVTNHSCENSGHIYDKWFVTKESTVFKKGKKEKECYNCSKVLGKSIEKIKPTIKLSSTSKTIKQLHTFKLKVTNIASGDSIEKVTVSSSKILSVSRSKNTITVKGKNTGTATITVKLKSGKEGKCKVKVKEDTFTYDVKKLYYSTRNNYYSVKLKNTSKHTVTIYATGAQLIDWDYKIYDRKVKNVNGESSIKIKPGETVQVKFKLKGESTWPGYDRKTIKFKIKFDGKTKWIKISQKDL